jgi:hypothetical protein
MNDQIKNEVMNMMLYDQFNNTTAQMDIINKANKLLIDNVFFANLRINLDKFFNSPNGVSITDMGAIVLNLQSVVSGFENFLNLYRGLSLDQVKYILYACLYAYILKYQSNFFNTSEKLGNFRLEYDNIFGLIKIPSIVYQAESKFFKRIWQKLCSLGKCECDCAHVKG